jgi:hypothetical protein
MTPPIYRDGRLVLEEYHPDPFELLPDLDVKSTWWPGGWKKSRCWYHEKLVGSDHLLVCVGDSWTWGDCLSPEDNDNQYRLDHIYGTVLSTAVGCDFLQLAECGCSNYAMYERIKMALPVLSKKYTRITVVVTLTENGRELRKTDTWARAVNWDNLENFDQFFIQYEQTMFEDFCELFTSYSNVTPVIARNFTYSFDCNRHILQDWTADLTWVDILAQNQTLPEYPQDLRFMSMIATGPIYKYLDAKKLSFYYKQSMMPHMDQAIKAIQWFNRSKLNNQRDTKHPTEQGHKLWAEYLSNILSK